MDQLDKDVELLDFFIETSKNWMPDNYYKLNMRLLNYMKELQMLRLRQILNVKTELNSVESQMQLSKSELERWQRWQIAGQMQDQSQITKQGEMN